MSDKSEKLGRIVKVSGPLVVAENMSGTRMYDVVRVSEQKLVGEIIELKGDLAWIQVYEETGGIGPGEAVYLTGKPLSVELGPGLIESIYDGIQRPLPDLYEQGGEYIGRGASMPGLDREKKWQFEPVENLPEEVRPGQVLGQVQETTSVAHKIMVPPGVSGKLSGISGGQYTVTDTIGQVDTAEGTVDLRLMQTWPVRQPRPYGRRLSPREPLLTGQRVIDMLFPMSKGGTACVPGPFGSGKTVVQHQLAKWVDTEVVVYVGCGERGNEMTDVLMEFPELKDPRSGEPLMKRSVLIANTSNMPVAAREASVYTGITIAEYFRDMGYSVALMADSTSRWAEAMREISARLEEMPAEEGYPAYLAARIASFYERSGRTECLGGDHEEKREGTLSVIGAVSPPGGDLSDSVVQATLRVVKVFWSLEASLAAKRHFPAIDWLRSYSLYRNDLREWFEQNVSEDFGEMVATTNRLLEEEDQLQEIVKLVGADALSPAEQLTLETSRSIREDFLHQNAYHEVDTHTSMKKQFLMLSAILNFHEQGLMAIKRGADVGAIISLPLRESIARARYLKEEEIDQISELLKQIESELDKLAGAEDAETAVVESESSEKSESVSKS